MTTQDQLADVQVAYGNEARSRMGAADERVVSCASELFLERGIASVKMTDIAEASDVGVATLYRHFSTKVTIAVEAAILMWQRFNRSIHDLVESDEFLEMNGAERLEALFAAYCSTYVYHADFVRFLEEFDHLVQAESPDPGLLAAYGQTVDSFYFIFEDAYLMGRADGSVSREVDFPVFYRAVAHALMGVAGKLVRGEVIPSDDFSASIGKAELECIVDMAIRSLKAS